jgi:hypothetical protein
LQAASTTVSSKNVRVILKYFAIAYLICYGL